MEEFVGKNATIQQEDLMLRWIKFLGVADSTYIATTGSIAQAIADVSEKASGYSSQWGDVLSWNKDLLTTQLSTKEVRTEIHARMDSLQRQFDRVIGVAENAPQTAAELLDELNDQFNELMSTANASLYRVFDELEHQRQDIQSFIDSQRTRLIAQADTLAAHTVRTAMDMLPSVVGRLALYIALAIVVLFSIPFALGYLAGRARSRRKAKNNDRENTPDPNNR